jgi:hypothetical protein
MGGDLIAKNAIRLDTRAASRKPAALLVRFKPAPQIINLRATSKRYLIEASMKGPACHDTAASRLATNRLRLLILDRM